MTRGLLAAAFVALAACSVKLEGGRCESDQNCLEDERCDPGAGRCVRCQPEASCPAQDVTCADATTVRTCLTNHGGCRYLSSLDTCANPLICQDPGTAASCVCPPLGPNAGESCATLNQAVCDSGSNVLTCQQSGTCLVWTAAAPSCATQGLLCATTSGSAACECPAYGGSDFYADSLQGSSALVPPYASGAQSPAACRFRTLTQALAKAAGYVAPPTKTANVRATGWTSGPPMTFSKAGGEIFPLVVANGVTLTTSDGALVPGSYVISIDDAAAPSGVDLQEGSGLSGLVVQSATATGAGVSFVCATGTASPLVQSVKVDGATKLAYAVSATGSCGAQLTSVDAGGAASAALLVDAPAGPAVAVVGGLFHASKVGILVKRGSVALTNVEVANNTSPGSAGGVGILAGNTTAAAGDIHILATGLLVHDNDDTGIQLEQLTGASTVSIVSSDVYLNKALTAASTYGAGLSRRAGGILLWGLAPTTPLTFQKNRVYRNLYDQVGVYSSGPWSLYSGDATCSPPTVPPVTANVFTCRDVAHSGYLVYSTVGLVDAARNVWQTDPVPAGDVNNVSTVPTCGQATIVCP